MEFIDLAMKLPDGQTINSSISAPKGPSSPVSSEKTNISSSTASITSPIPTQKQTVSASQLEQLTNTWGKVSSSQPLSPEQVQRLIEQGSALNKVQGETNTTKQAATAPVLSDQIKQLESQLKDNPKAIAELKLFLVKLETQQGLLSLLSQSTMPKGNHVLISQNTQGAWQLQSPSQGFSLTNLTAQFSGSTLTPPPIDLSVLPSTGKLGVIPQAIPSTLSTASLSSPPLTTIQSGAVITAELAQSAILNSGQSLEHKLLKLAEAAVQSIKPSTESPTSSPAKSDIVIAPDFKGRFKQVEQQVNQWVKQLVNEMPSLKQSLSGQTTTSQPTVNPPSVNPPPVTSAASAQVSNLNTLTTGPGLSPQADKTSAAINSLLQTDSKSTAAIVSNEDNKSWLIKNQQQLLTAFTKNLVSNNSFIPNWSSTGQFKNSGELSELFNLLLAPKMSPSEGGKSIWPNNLSAQSQLQQTLKTLVAHLPDGEKDSAQSQLLRQILSLSQGLMKLQHDQVHNRLGQQSDLSSPLQMSLPYVHQDQVQWADMEFKQSEFENENKEKTTGWHLILRFAQDSPQSFAVETQLKQNQLAVVLWAAEKEQLKNLNSDISLLKEKLNYAGFNIESITSKHGAPAKISKPIQQSLVDVHT
jgi:hypothetical protein